MCSGTDRLRSVEMIVANTKTLNSLPLSLEMCEAGLTSDHHKQLFLASRARLVDRRLKSIERFEIEHCSFLVYMINFSSSEWTLNR